MVPPKFEAPSTKERQPALPPPTTIASKGRRAAVSTNNGSLSKDAVAAQTVTDSSGLLPGAAEAVGINWSTLDRSTLHAYRHAYRLNTPSAFTCAHNELVLTGAGPGRYSPSMARAKDRRRVSKEQLALAVRKDFNAAAVVEQEVVTSFLYSVHNQNKHFRMRFAPTRSK